MNVQMIEHSWFHLLSICVYLLVHMHQKKIALEIATKVAIVNGYMHGD